MSVFNSERNTSTQTATVSGEGNQVHQTIQNIWITDGESPAVRKLVEAAQAAQEPVDHSSFAVDDPECDDREESKRILEYRQIATDGDSATALSLLRSLTKDAKYETGHLAFRLHFNIGAIQYDIGDYSAASNSLRSAHSLYPEDHKAQSALAFAELLDGEHRAALDRCRGLLQHEGDHRNLAASVLCHAARHIKTEVAPEDFVGAELSSPEVLPAYLEYVRDVRPDGYERALTKAFNDNNDNKPVANMWALSILDDARQNQAFLLGARMPVDFVDHLADSAKILKKDLEDALKLRPPNKILLPSQANNAAVALRLSGSVSEAARLIDETLAGYPELRSQLAQIRAVLFLQEDRDIEALELIRPLSDNSELQIMASQIEAKLGEYTDALERIESVLGTGLPADTRSLALDTKARIAINSSNQERADQALDELNTIAPDTPELLLLRSAYERAFVIQSAHVNVESRPGLIADASEDENKLLASLNDADEWDFFTILRTADELIARGHFRECSDLLKSRVSFSSESPALRTLCDACLLGHLGNLAKEINEQLSEKVKSSVFGWRFGANVAVLTGEVAKAVPLARRLFEHNSSSISALEWYVQMLSRTNDRSRVQRLIRDQDDLKLSGTVSERCQYVTILVHCGEIERARDYAYRLFCQNQNDHRAWMALSASVLAVGSPPGAKDDLDVTRIQENSTFAVQKPDGSTQTFTLETDEELYALRDGNINLDHPVALAALGKTNGEEFDWPLKGNGIARVASVKHKSLAAFHQIIERFEDQFPEASGFKSVSVNFEKDDGLDEMKALLRQRAEYSQQKAKEYSEGSYPIYILGHHLGIDPIDTFLGLKQECGFSPKVSSCSHEDQANAATALKEASERGIIADASASYLIRRLGIENAIEGEFGRIAVTQETIDIFARKLQNLESSSFLDEESGSRRVGSIAVRDGQISLTELTGDQVSSMLDLLHSDLEWLKGQCELVPAVAKVDPPDEVIRFREEEGGRFFDDIFAADGTDRLLLSEDYHLRSWASALFGVKGAWIQAMMFHLEGTGHLTIQEAIKCTLQLQELGEDALSTNAARILMAAEMLSRHELSKEEFEKYCSLLGQCGADMPSHIEVAVAAMQGLWKMELDSGIRGKVTSVILRNLTSLQGSDTYVVLDTVESLVRGYGIRDYIEKWRVGHFLVQD